MSTLIGILLDVSGSMRSSVGGNVEEKGGSWAKSIFKVVDELIKHDVSSSNQTFALALGSSSHPAVFDLLSTLSKAQEEPSSIEKLKSRKSRIEMIDEALAILTGSGAGRGALGQKGMSCSELLTILPLLHYFTTCKKVLILPENLFMIVFLEYAVNKVILSLKLVIVFGALLIDFLVPIYKPMERKIQ